MTILDDRENAFEKKFAHDEELRFKVIVRRNRLLGLWAAQLLGKRGEEASAYAADVVAAGFEPAGKVNIIEKIRADLDAAGVVRSQEEVYVRMIELLAAASEEVLKT